MLFKAHSWIGPIVRVSPREVHIKDPDYYDEIYASASRRREKDAAAVGRFDLDGSSFASVSPETHRQRRAPVEKFFSKAAITRTESTIQFCLHKLVQHLEGAYHSHKVISLDAGFSALTSDIIHQYVFGFNSGNLDQEDFNENIRDGISGLFRMGHIAFFFPIIQTILNVLPLSVVKMINPYAFALKDQKTDVHNRVVRFLSGEKSESGSVIEKLSSPDMPEHFRSADNLTDEGFSLVIGGTETTARSLSLGMYHLLSEPHLLKKLREEIRAVMPTPESKPTWNELEQLPYLVSTAHAFRAIAESLIFVVLDGSCSRNTTPVDGDCESLATQGAHRNVGIQEPYHSSRCQ
jgi:cytochrome P450